MERSIESWCQSIVKSVMRRTRIGYHRSDLSMDEIKSGRRKTTSNVVYPWTGPTARAGREVSRLNIRVSKPGKYVQHLYN